MPGSALLATAMQSQNPGAYAQVSGEDNFLGPGVRATGSREIVRDVEAGRLSAGSLFLKGRVGDPDDMDDEVQPFSEDMFGMASACLIRDLHFLQKGGHTPRHNLLRGARTLNNVGLLLLTIFLQVYLLIQVKTFVTAPAVEEIRKDYDTYEVNMYSKSFVNANGYHRGSGHFNQSHFEALDNNLKDVVCSFPLSQPTFFFIILFMWSSRMCHSFRSQLKWWTCLILNTADSRSMVDCFKNDDGQEWYGDDDTKERVVYRLPFWVKAILGAFVGLPRLSVSLVLLWLGCRWLCSTTSFADLIMNAVGLEFIMDSKDLLYEAFVSYRSKTDVAKTMMLPFKTGKLSLDVAASFGPLGWALLAAIWAYLYITHFQSVLPGYEWDIRKVCEHHQALELEA